MKRYRSHKVVEAAKIVQVVFRSTNYEILLAPGEETVRVSDDWISRHLPADETEPGFFVGGYFVRYADGYESWSPAEAFEEGYTACGEPDEPPEPTAEQDGSA